MQKLNPKMKLLRKKARTIDGMPMVSRLWVKAYLTSSELTKFKKKYGWKTYKILGIVHKPDKVKRYAYFWDLHTLLDGG